MQNKIFNVYYADLRMAVVLEADLGLGWEKLRKTYGFFRQTRIPYRDDLTIRAQLSVIAQPASFRDWAAQFPQMDINVAGSIAKYVIKDRRLIARVSLAAGSSWRKTERGRPEIFVAEQPFMTREDGNWYDLRIWLVFHEPGSRHVPDVRAWLENKLLLPGGQIESNRRRH